MQLLKTLKLSQSHINEYDITLFQTPAYGLKKGYRKVYRIKIEGKNHEDVLYKVFATFNTVDSLPKDFHSRYIGTGDIVFIDEGRNGHYYYQLKSGGWQTINRIHIR
ncbi:MAG: YodL domain-containing protein [Heyndrickxia sp.]